MLTSVSILSNLEDTAHLYPSKPALIYENSTLTFEKLHIFSNQLAHFFKQKGNFSNLPLCFCLDQSLEKVITMLAIWKAEGAYVSLDPLYPELRLQHILEDIKSPLLITTQSYAEKFSFFKGQIVLIDEQKQEIRHMPESTPKYEITEGLAYLAYTSGSTGVPKAVMAEHKGLKNLVEQFGVFLDPQKEDTALNLSSSNFDGIVIDLWVPLSKGITVFLYPDNRIVGEPLLNYIRENGITILPYLPVSVLSTLPTDQPIGKLRKICTGGEAPIPSVIESWKKKTELINIYGPTETTVVVSGFKFDESHPMSTIGKPLANVDFYVLDDKMNLLPVNETGELYIGGIQVSRGYYNRPDLTAEKFLEYKTPENKIVRVYKTGDLVRRLKDDTIEFAGRADQQLKIRGFRVEPAEIEEHIRQSGLVENSIIIAKQKQNVKQLICFYKNKKNKNSYPEDIRAYLFMHLPSYMIPSQFLEVESFPLTANGKIDKSVLNTYKTTEEKRKSFVPARNTLQSLLADAWSSILGMKSIGIYDNFFRFGGNSILAYRLVSLLRKELGLSLQTADLFSHPTIHEIEKYIKKQQSSNQADETVPLDQDHPIPLSSQQQSLWLIDKLYGSIPYNIGVLYPMHKDVSLSILENALRTLIKKHSILRTTIEEKDNHPYVSVMNADHWLLHTQHSSDNIKNLVTIPFDLQRDYMLRAYIIYDSNAAASLLLVIHHMVTDGWSMPLIVQEINTLYQEITNNKAEECFNTIIEYKHYAVWQSKQKIEDGITFWKEYLEDVPVLQTAHDFKKLHNHPDSGEQYQFEIDEELTEKLKKISKEQSATLYMTLLSAFSLLMQYYSGQQDICIGSPSANRPHPFDKTIGYFTNMLPIRIKIDENPVFIDFLKQIRNMIPQIFRHQGVPLDIIINQVIKDRFAGHNPLFQNIFVLQDPVEGYKNSFPVQTEKVEWIHNKRIKFDLQFEVLQTDGKLKVNIDYSDALFKKQTIVEMAARFQYLLKSIILNPNQKIGDINLYAAVDKKNTVSKKETVIPKTLLQMFEEQVQKTPDKAALRLSGISISYRSLDEKSSIVANHLIGLGIKNDDFAACYHEQSIERIIILLGILKAGAAYVPLDITYPMERIKLLLEDTEPKIIIGSAKFSQIKNEAKQPVYFIEDILKSSSKTILRSYCHTHTHTDLAYVIHTSGTTGKPKGVLIEHQSLGNFITEYGKLLDINEEDRTLQFSPYNFDGSVIDLWIPLTKGATVYLYPNNKLLGEYLSEFLSLHAITIIPFISPSVLSTLPQTFHLPSIRVIGTGAETCPSQVSQYWKPLVKLVNMYGPTETTVAVNEFVFDDSHPDHTIGTAIKNMRLYVLDQYLRQVPARVTGELYISGIQLSKGYLNQPELTAEKFIKNHFIKEKSTIYSRMYKTGDQVRTLSDGMLEYIGRIDHQVKVRGYRIELTEIENALLQIKGIKNAKVHVHKASETMKSLRAFVTGDSHISNIRSELSRKLPAYMVPNEIFTVKIIPLKSNGKIDSEALASMAEHNTAETLELEGEPSNEYEKVIKEIWTEVLQCRVPSMEDDFFHLGGHSLLLTKMYNKLFKQFPNTITLSELYINNTVRKQALLIEERERNPHTLHYALGKDPLSDEIRKDADVKPEKFKFNISKKGNFENPEAVLLTGVTGFVGINMFAEILKTTSADLYLLIRADNEPAAEKRLLKAMEDQLIPVEIYDKKRVTLLPGDLSKPFLGLIPQKYEDLTKTIDVVHHAGSAVNFIQPYSYMRAANVDALHTMIQFVTTYKLKQLSLLSTVGVFSWEHYFTKPAIITENTDTASAFKYLSRDMGYIQSKWVMEKVAQAAIKQGIPIIIFRLGYVFCHSVTGATARYQWWGLLVKTCIQLKVYPILTDQKEELVMVDFVSKAIAHISKNSDSIGEIFHLSPEAKDNMTVMEFFEFLHTELNFDLKPVPYLEWRALWENDENSPLYPLLNLFKFPAYDNKSIIEIHQNTPDFDISNTNRFLKGSSIENTKINRDTVEAFCKYLGVL